MRHSALVTAVNYQHRGLVSELLKRGEDPNVPDGRFGWTALHTAVDLIWDDQLDDRNTPRSMVVIAELLKGGADPNFRDLTGCTPFHNFIYGWHNEETRTSGVITWVDYGGNPDIRNNDGSNCWSCGNLSLLASLREAIEKKKNAIIG